MNIVKYPRFQPSWPVRTAILLSALCLLMSLPGCPTLSAATVTPSLSPTLGDLKVTLTPAAAVTAGARWRVDAGAWKTSGTTIANLSPGGHTLSFKAVTGYKAPANIAVNLVAGQLTATTAAYIPTGSVTVNITPATAVTEGAQWHVDTGAWQNSGVTLTNVTEGAHTITFKSVTGWTKPASIAINVVGGGALTYSGAYAPVGSLNVTLLPAAAVTAGARWKLDSGAWRTSGTTLNNIAEGPHTVSFKAIANWATPATLPVTITHGKTSTLSATYTQGGKVSISLEPSPAIDEGAQWALDGGTMNPSGATLEKIAPGAHTISFATIAGWTTPQNLTVNVAEGQTATASTVYKLTLGNYVMIANNDLGMHCMNQDFSEFMILPPYNTVHAQVIRRGAEPHLTTSGISISYRIPGNTTSVTKTNFWQYANDLFGAPLAADVGLTGNRLTGTMKRSATNEADYEVIGIPITQIMDNGENRPLQIGEFKAFQGSTQIARTNTVLPVSWEISCDLCHNQPGASVATNILRAHDRLHMTDLEHSKPVVCGACHGQPPLGLAGAPGVPTLSSAMHSSHATRIPALNLENGCYACHPGLETKCLRDVHSARGMNCVDCHGDMAAVGNPARHPWQDEPRCGDCHQRSGFHFEEPGKLYRDSKGHHEVECWVCHGSPHAITPTTTAADNTQALMLQGHSGVLDCAVCHINKPRDEFEHHL